MVKHNPKPAMVEEKFMKCDMTFMFKSDLIRHITDSHREWKATQEQEARWCESTSVWNMHWDWSYNNAWIGRCIYNLVGKALEDLKEHFPAEIEPFIEFQRSIREDHDMCMKDELDMNAAYKENIDQFEMHRKFLNEVFGLDQTLKMFMAGHLKLLVWLNKKYEIRYSKSCG